MGLLNAHWGEPGWWWALVGVPVAGLLMLWAWRQRRRALAMFLGAKAGAERSAAGRAARVARAGMVLVAMGLTVVALARPQWNPKEEEVTLRGRDVVFLVDVSRSMLAQDVSPSRLGRAKIWINDLVGSLKGDRVALVGFAGAAVVECPLTLDYGYFRMALEELSPASVPRGGTLIGDAIRKTMAQVFDQTASRHRDIILITDGEDHESFPVQSAEGAGKDGVRIIALAVGSESAGALVPEEKGGGFVSYEGEQVRSKADPGMLEKVAAASAGGVFLNVGTGTVDLERVYADLVQGAEQSETATKTTVRYEEKFQVFLGAAVLLLMGEALVGMRRK
jgi:Ca-activated chloride channel family protein